MAQSISNQRVDDPNTRASTSQAHTPVVNQALEQPSAPTSNAPNLKSKSLNSDQLAARQKTGLGKKLLESFINRSAATTLANLNQAKAETECTAAAMGTLEDIETVDRTLRERKCDKEYPSVKRCLISNSHLDSQRSPYRPTSHGMVAIHSGKKATGSLDEQPVIPSKLGKVPASLLSPLSLIKGRVEDLLSTEAPIGHLFNDIEWTSFPDPYSPEEPDSLNRFAHEADSPPRNPRVGEKRKATDEMNPVMLPKRLRFSEDDLSRASESPIEQVKEKLKPLTDYEREIDRLSKELATDYEPAYESMSPEANTTAATTKLKKSHTSPMNIGNLGESVRRARERSTIWFTTTTDQSASITAQTTLKLLLEANDKKIHKSAFNSLQELFALIPAGAILGTEFFDQALKRAVGELSLSAEQWREVDDLYRQYDQLHLLSNPRSSTGFKELLGRIIAIKNSMFEDGNLSPPY